MPTWAQQIKGVVIDQKSKETLIGAVITVDGTNVKAITNIDGNFQIDGLNKEKTYTLYINYVGYKTQKIDGVQAKDADQVIALQPDEQQLKSHYIIFLINNKHRKRADDIETCNN